MRRRWLLILGGVVALVGVAALFYPSIRVVERISSGSTENPEPMSPAPFRFLEGHEPLRMDSSFPKFTPSEASVAVYSWKAEYGVVLAKAETELIKLGFRGTRGADATWFTRSRSSSNRKPPEDSVYIMKDTRWTEPVTNKAKQTDKGWVSIGIILVESPGL